jgi:hypothetical protein
MSRAVILSDNGGYTMQPQNKDASAVVPPHGSAQPKRFSRLIPKIFLNPAVLPESEGS